MNMLNMLSKMRAVMFIIRLTQEAGMPLHFSVEYVRRLRETEERLRGNHSTQKSVVRDRALFIIIPELKQFLILLSYAGSDNPIVIVLKMTTSSNSVRSNCFVPFLCRVTVIQINL